MIGPTRSSWTRRTSVPARRSPRAMPRAITGASWAVFQLNSVSRPRGLTRVINDWEVGLPGFFGINKQATLTAYLVSGTAPGIVTGHEQPISNVVHETFTTGR